MIQKLRKMLFVALFFTLSSLPITAYAQVQITSTGYDDLESKLSDVIISGETDIDISYKLPDTSPSGDISKLFAWGGLNLAENKDIDYAFYNINSVELQWSSSQDSRGYWSISLQLNTKSNSDETKYVNDSITEILSKQNFTGYTDYEKYLWIYDYIVSNCSYDYSLKMDTAYNALHDGKTTCGGFASLYYLMTKDLGLPCKIVYGKTGDILHAWNLVELNKKWYCVDTTWGSYYQDRSYFLKAKNSLTTHIFDSSYNNSDINFASSDYNSSPITTKTINKSILLGESLKLSIPEGSIIGSYDISVCTLNSSGVLKGLAVGKTRVSIKPIGGSTETVYNISVLQSATSINAPESLTVTYGKTKKMSISLAPSNASTLGLKFKSLNTSILTVDKKGVVTGIKAGKSYVDISYGSSNFKVRVPITVTAYIDSTYNSISITKGKTKSLANAVLLSSKGYTDLVYKTTDSKVATVSTKGTVKGIKKGTCNIVVYNKVTNKKITTIKVKIS